MAVEKFIFELEKEDLQPTIPQEEIDDIELGVNQFVKLLTDEVAKDEKLFTVKRIIKVGSFYEKTKVGNPDEFDFLLELDGTYEVERGCELDTHARSAYVKVIAPVCTNEPELRSKKIINPDGYLYGRRTYDLWKSLSFCVLLKACRKENSLYRIQCKMGHLTTNEDIFMVVFGKVGPNVEISLEWHGENGIFTIKIDLCICIPCTYEQLEIWQSELIPGIDFSAESRPIFVVPSLYPRACRTCSVRCGLDNISCQEAYWKISMAPIEVEHMRNIPEPYKLCYRVLKWMEKGRMKDFFFCVTCALEEEILSSYILKNALLCCQANNKQKEPASCLEEVLQYLLECADRECLPAYFMPKINLWHNRASKDAPPRDVIVMLMDYLFKTLKNSSAESLNFNDVRSTILHGTLMKPPSKPPSREISDKDCP